ncbi:oocyte zinc finger protein XlCOF7.1-like [Pseudophryne corroboree]|uniref:oocyte zinc finger protein XlCOF7.1-like n=1 Tax=Pseudophryne corroboree TaxID=495146 RepID=UPI0030816BDB
MGKARSHRTEKILNLTLEIIYLLIEKDYIVENKTSVHHETPSSRPCVSGGLDRIQSLIMEPPPHSLIHERDNDQKILELTNKIIQLLTGEVPIRCQDVTVYLSMEEWEYIERHKDLYKDVMMENHQPFTALDGPSIKDNPERCPRPLYSQDCTPENHRNPQEDQSEGLTDVKVDYIEGEEETCVRGDYQCKEEEIPTDISTDGGNSRNMSEEYLILSPDFKIEENITQDDPGENPFTPITHPVPLSADMSSDPSNHEQCPPDKSDIATHSTALRVAAIAPCSVDGQCFTQETKLITHQPVKASVKSFSCSECGKCFPCKSHFVMHQRCHTGEKPFSCSKCGRCFTQKSNLVRHERSHSGSGNHFTDKAILTHEMLNTREKPFPCAECGKCFTHKCTLVSHQQLHTGEKFPCANCGKSFMKKSHLVTHQSCHTGEKPFLCSECGKCFTKKSNLVRHERSHTGVKPFPCSECGKCFTYRSALVLHQRSHTGETL